MPDQQEHFPSLPSFLFKLNYRPISCSMPRKERQPPKKSFQLHLKAEKGRGNQPVSEFHRGPERSIVFQDGGTLKLLLTGHMIHRYANGRKIQNNPKGEEITVGTVQTIDVACCNSCHTILRCRSNLTARTFN